MLTRLILALLLCVALGVPAGALMTAGRAPGGGSSASNYTPLCSLGVTCVYAYSTERKMVAGATTALVVQRSVDNTTQNIGFTGSGLVNTQAVDSFCDASVAGTISRNCYIQGIVDQTGNGCLLFNSLVSGMPNYMVDPSHQGLPRFQKVFQGSGSAINFILDSGGGQTSTPSHLCSTLTGGAQALFYAGNSSYAAFSSGQAGLTETVPASGPEGSMFSAFTGPPGFVYDKCLTSAPCGGLDSEGEGPQANYTRTGNDDFIDIATTAGGTGPFNIWVNGVQITTNETNPVALVTKNRMTWGHSGDWSTNGPNISRSEAFFTVNLTTGQQSALYSNETAFTGALTQGYQGPADLVGGETSYSAGLTNYKNLQLMWLSQAFSLRKTYASYEGPAVNVCQGSGSCEDIGWVNNVIDTATMSAFCGPASFLNNCAVQIWYNQALNQTPTLNGVDVSADATAVSSSNRPTVVWSGCGTTAITVCIATSSTNYFTTSTSGLGVNGASGFSMSAVAQRTGNFTTAQAVYASTNGGSGSQNFLGFAASAKTCQGAASTTIADITVACNDSAVHGITVDANRSGSSVAIYADGTAGTPHSGAIAYSGGGLGIGATGAGLQPCTCQISEFLLFADGSNSSFATGLGSAKVAAILANQEAAFGFGGGSGPSDLLPLMGR